MLKILKRIIILSCVALLLLVVGVFMYIDHVAKVAIESGATFALGVETTIKDTDIGILSGTSSLSGLTIFNPDDFSTPHLLKIENSEIKISYNALREKIVHIPSLILDGVNMHIENRQGRSNLTTVIESLKRFESDANPEDDDGKTRFIFDEIIITNIYIQTELLPIGGQLIKVELPIDRIRLTNVGGGKYKGLKIGEVVGVIFKAIIMGIIHNGLKLPEDIITDLVNGLSVLQPLSELGIGVVVGVGEAAFSIIEGIGGLLEGIGEGFGNLLGGDQKKGDP